MLPGPTTVDLTSKGKDADVYAVRWRTTSKRWEMSASLQYPTTARERQKLFILTAINALSDTDSGLRAPSNRFKQVGLRNAHTYMGGFWRVHGSYYHSSFDVNRILCVFLKQWSFCIFIRFREGIFAIRAVRPSPRSKVFWCFCNSEIRIWSDSAGSPREKRP